MSLSPLVPALRTSRRSAAQFSLPFPIRELKTATRSPLCPPFSRLNVLVQPLLQPLAILVAPSVLRCFWEPDLDPLSRWGLQTSNRGKESPPLKAEDTDGKFLEGVGKPADKAGSRHCVFASKQEAAARLTQRYRFQHLVV